MTGGAAGADGAVDEEEDEEEDGSGCFRLLLGLLYVDEFDLDLEAGLEEVEENEEEDLVDLPLAAGLEEDFEGCTMQTRYEKRSNTSS